MPDIQGLYRRIMALNSASFNTCFYCGCIATEYDKVPPIKLARYFLTTGEEADFYEVPCCRECVELLRGDKSGLLGQRTDVAKSKLAKKYEKAIRVYQLWTLEEMEDFDYNFKTSLTAGIALGKESDERVRFAGYDFEADGQTHSAFYIKAEPLSVFGEKFDNFVDALDYASKAYRVPKATMKQLFAEHDNNFDNAIQAFQLEAERVTFEKTLKMLCGEFSAKHKQNISFVLRTVKLYIKQDKELTIEAALDKLHEKYINTRCL